MNNPWKTTKTNLVYKNKFGYSLFDNEVIHPTGKIGTHMVLESSDFVMIVALDQNNQAILLNQWRYPVAKQIIELPAGRIEEDETPLETAKKELLEETGAASADWVELGTFPFMVGIANIKGHYFLAKNSEINHQRREVDKAKSEVVILDLDKIDYSKTSAETALGLLLAKKYL